jgi:hypothetical protein
MPGQSDNSAEIAMTSMTRAGLAACLLVTASAWGQIRYSAKTPLDLTATYTPAAASGPEAP